MTNEKSPMLLVERGDGVLTITLARPATGNALSPDMVTALTSVLATQPGDRSIRAVLLRGEGRHFTTGGDVRWFASLLDGPAVRRREAFGRLMAAAAAMVTAFVAIDVPVVVACRGVVAGGGLALVLAADMVIADASATFLFSHRHIGLPPDGGVSWLLPRIVGQRRAAELILEGATVDAQAALDMRLISRLVEADALDAQAVQLARRFADGPATALRSAKVLVRSAAHDSLFDQLARETSAMLDAIEHEDFAEGTRAFLERRAPLFRPGD